MTATEDFYLLWIASDEATKYRNSPKYRHSEMMAFAEAYSEHQNKINMKTKIEILDSCLGEHLKDIQPTVYVLILDAITKYAEQKTQIKGI